MAHDHNKNFRLRGIPDTFRTRADVRELVKRVLSIEARESVVVYSLATNPIEPNSKVATLSFRTIPNCLSGCPRNEWIFNLVEDETSDDDDASGRRLLFDTHFSGFTPLQRTKDDDCHIDVIAMSGLNGHAFGSFKAKDGSFMWLRDGLPQDVPGARILIYGYDTQLILSSSFQNLSDLGKSLQLDLKGIRVLDRSRPIIFIGHSLGGLVIKEAIVKLREDLEEEDVSILKSSSGFLFFGVPHQGMAIESLIPLVNDYPNRSLLESLNKNSALLQRLQKEFSKAFDTTHPRIISFYETEKSPTAVKNKNGKWELCGPLEILVDVSSATCGSNKQHPINRHHSGLVKYSSQYDELYRRVHTALRPLADRLQHQSVRVSNEVGKASFRSLSNENYECLRSLSFREQQHRYSDIYSAKDTCKWLLEDPQYQAWMNKTQGLFWIKGNPGAGKSVLMKFAVENMECKKTGDLVVSFFIHGRGIPLQKTPLGIFRALLHSMLESFPEHLCQLTTLFCDRETRFGSYQDNRWVWKEKELEEYLFRVLTKGTRYQPVVIFIDALDECGQFHGSYLLESFKRFMDSVKGKDAQVRICFSSRHYPILGLSTIPTIFVEERNDNDLRLVIRERLKEIQPPEKRQRIEGEILLKAHGGFQWAVLVVALVRNENAIGIREERLYEKIAATPEALDELYTDILGGATEAERHQMAKLFQWVLFAARPLSAQELREALATDSSMGCTTISELRNHRGWSDTLAQFEMYIRHISRGLVEFQTRDVWEQYEPGGENWDREAQFVHQSVADYVLGKFLSHIRDNSTSRSSLTGAGHFEISRSCLRYITLREVLDSARLSRGTLSTRFPLLPYMVQFLFYHVREVEVREIPQPDLLPLLQLDRQCEYLGAIASVWRVMDPENVHTPMGWPFIEATPLHVLVALGSKSGFDAFLQTDDIEVDGRDSGRNTPLLLALREGRQDMALALLNRFIEWQFRPEAVDENITEDQKERERMKHFVNINAENSDGETPLSIALTEDAEEVILKLIEAGADLLLFRQETALVFYAIRNRNKLVLLKLAEQKVKLDGAVYFALQELSGNDDDTFLEECVLELLKAGASTSKCLKFYKRIGDEDEDDDEEDDEDKDEAVFLAAGKGQATFFNLLMSHCPLANLHNNYQRSLLVAARNGHEVIVKLVLERGAEIGSSDTCRRESLLWASRNGHEAVARLLIDKGTDINHSDRDGWTSLLWASQNGHEAVVRLLIDKGADINYYNGNGWTSLLWASQNGHEAVARLLIDKGADINRRNGYGWTSLIWASQNGHEAVARLLIDKGADINHSDRDGWTSLLWASQNGHEAVVRLLIDKGVDINHSDGNGWASLLWASLHGHKAVARLLIDKGADINHSNGGGWTSLLWASRNGHEAVARLLIDKGADINYSDRDGCTSLLWASRNGHEAVARLLIDKGADINYSNRDGWTSLLWASRNGHEAVARLLIDKGADINRRNGYGWTSLIWASQNGHEAVARLLIDKGADINHSDRDGWTSLLWASQNGHEAVARLLIDKGADAGGSNNDR